MNILDIAIAKKLAGGGGGSGTDNYNDLSNLPQINGETLAGNKTAENLGLQDALTFDSAPTEDSTNPVESGGVYNALAGKQDNLTFDDDPTENSTNPVKSGGVYSALAGKQDNLTFDGVYNASTNKAATESTVTNAIAGLDVSDFSVDADETISSISETDGKINVTKQDIAIASNQVTAMTGYTKPSSAPATPAIQTSDTANQAFGKLEFKADTNQTNILSVQNATEELVDSGAKNRFNFDAWKTVKSNRANLSFSGNAITLESFVADAFTAYEVDPSASLQFPSEALIPFTIGEHIVLTWDYIANSGQTDDKVFIFAYDSAFQQVNAGNTLAQNKKIQMSIPSGTAYVTFRVGVTTSGNSATYSNLMICTKPQFEISPAYEPHALPNYDLTQLQAEDRASLRNLVDESDKNRVISNINLIKQNNNGWSWVGNTASLNGVTITVNDDLTLVASGQMTASSALIFTVINRTTDNINIFKETGYHYIHGNLGDNSSSISFRCNYTGNNVPVEIAADTSGNGTPFNVTDEMKNSANGVWYLFEANSPAFSNVHLKPMICKCEDWYISNEYVPPVMSHTEAVKQINENTGKIQTLNDKMAELIDTKIYGFKISKTDKYPSTRVEYMYDAVGMRRAYMDYNTNEFNYGDWGDVWFVKENRPVALKYDRTVDYELDPTDYWKKKDGTASDLEDPTYAGNFMSEIPLIYIKRWEDDDYCYCAVSNKKVDDGFKADAFTKADGTISTHIYYPMFAGSLDSNNRLRSIAGVHYLEQTSIADEITYAENNGANYQIKDLSKHDLLTDLLILMGKSTNIQFTFGIGITGLTVEESDVLLSGYNVKDGSKATSAQFWGGIQNGTVFANDYRHIKVFHIEDFWGSAWQDTIGANLDADVYKVRTTPPYAVSPDATYQTLDVTVPSESWLQQMYFNASGHLPTVTGSPASNTMCYCTRFYKTATDIRSLATGGSTTQGYKCSPFFYNFQNAVDAVPSNKKRVYASLHTYSTTNVQGGA